MSSCASRWRAAAGLFLSIGVLHMSASAQSPAAGGDTRTDRPDPSGRVSDPVSPLPLRVPIRAVMAGIIDFSSHGVFITATAEGPLSDTDWLAAGLAALNLISAATLITTPAAGPRDSAWVKDPDWRRFALDMQVSSINAGIAVRQKSRPALLASAERLAQSCQSCHDQFRHDPSPGEATRLVLASP